MSYDHIARRHLLSYSYHRLGILLLISCLSSLSFSGSRAIHTNQCDIIDCCTEISCCLVVFVLMSSCLLVFVLLSSCLLVFLSRCLVVLIILRTNSDCTMGEGSSRARAESTVSYGSSGTVLWYIYSTFVPLILYRCTLPYNLSLSLKPLPLKWERNVL